jgi:hypothetical protein
MRMMVRFLKMLRGLAARLAAGAMATSDRTRDSRVHGDGEKLETLATSVDDGDEEGRDGEPGLGVVLVKVADWGCECGARGRVADSQLITPMRLTDATTPTHTALWMARTGGERLSGWAGGECASARTALDSSRARERTQKVHRKVAAADDVLRISNGRDRDRERYGW